ncbi:AbiH family protein [Fructilactobacillus fructivorans]|nr:AbiH family protein [Fructilactobacillus fructivorans]
MTENKQEADTLVIIGNGFDLNLGLKTSFQDYFDKNDDDNFNKEKKDFNDLLNKVLKDTTQNPNAINKKQMFGIVKNYFRDFNSTTLSFWDLYFLLLRYINENKIGTDFYKMKNWSNVESQIKNFFTKHRINNYSMITDFDELIDTQKLQNSHQLPGKWEYNHNQIITGNQTIPVYSFIKDDFKKIILPFLLDTQNIKNITYNELFNQLNKFEQNFSNYISKLPEKNKYYTEYYQNKLNKISESTWYNVLTFNYTPVPTKPIYPGENRKINHVRYIHGNTEDNKNNPIIIGIGSENIKPDSDIFIFTKTYRVLSESFNEYDDLIDEKVKNIIIFGHSLVEADYSYFKSIFEATHLYSSEIDLTFKYSLSYTRTRGYPDNIIPKEQLKIITELLNKYGQELNPNDGNDLMNKMMIENRLHITGV